MLSFKRRYNKISDEFRTLAKLGCCAIHGAQLAAKRAWCFTYRYYTVRITVSVRFRITVFG